jgi:hypothetical protein
MISRILPAWEMQSLEERLCFKVLAHCHCFLAGYQIEDISRWDRDMRKERLRSLEKARWIYEIE